MKITNTTTQKRNILDGLPGMIEASETHGQQEFINSTQLPIKGSCGGKEYIDRNIKIIGISEGDELFYDVELPAGWSKKATDHSMWNTLLNDKDEEIGNIFYKAAFYDRNAFINFTKEKNETIS